MKKRCASAHLLLLVDGDTHGIDDEACAVPKGALVIYVYQKSLDVRITTKLARQLLERRLRFIYLERRKEPLNSYITRHFCYLANEMSQGTLVLASRDATYDKMIAHHKSRKKEVDRISSDSDKSSK